MSLKNLGDVSYFRLNNEINRPINGQIPLHKDKGSLERFLPKMFIRTPNPLTALLIRFVFWLKMTILNQLLLPNTDLNLLRNFLSLFMTLIFALNHLWQPISSISSMLSKQMMVKRILKILKTVFSLMLFTLRMATKSWHTIWQWKWLLSATSQQRQVFLMLAAAAGVSWFLVSSFRSPMIWILSAVLSIQLCNCPVLAAVSVFLSAICAKPGHQSKVLPEQPLVSFLSWNFLKTAFLIPTN